MKKQQVVLATRNAGKIRELAQPLAAYGLEVLGLDAFPELEDVEETGQTFEENALLKAHSVAAATGLVAIADDSGLEVDALNKAPGVYSARYSNDMPLLEGENKDQRNNRKLLQALATVPQEKRTARFVCCMVACTPQGRHISVRGEWDGSILTSPQGDNGFGYDPLFWDASAHCSSAMLTREQKNARSHRGKALQKLMAAWQDFWNKA